MGGTLIVTTRGDVEIHGNLTVSGDLSVEGVLGANVISPVAKDLIINLESKTINQASGSGEATASSSFGSLVSDSRFLIKGNGGYTVTSFDASGNATISGTLETSELLTKKLSLLTEKAATDSAQSASIGDATLPSGQTTIVITSTSITEKSLIFITPTSVTDKTLYVIGKQNGQFTVGIATPTTTDIKFNWWVIN